MKQFFYTLNEKVQVLDRSFSCDTRRFNSEIMELNTVLDGLKKKLLQELSAVGVDVSSLENQCDMAAVREALQQVGDRRDSRVRTAREVIESMESVRLRLDSLERARHRAHLEGDSCRSSVIREIGRVLRKDTAAYEALDFGVSNAGEAFPTHLTYGEFTLSYEGNAVCSFPRVMPFPLQHGLHFKDDASGRAGVSEMLLRLFHCCPLKKIEVTAIDPKNLGGSLEYFQVMLKNETPFKGQRFLTCANEIEASLQKIQVDMEEMIQKKFVSGIQDWEGYNACHQDKMLPYRVVVLFGIPAQLTDRAKDSLACIIEHGPRCGVLPLICGDMDSLKKSRSSGLMPCFDNCLEADHLYASSGLLRPLTYLTLSETVRETLDIAGKSAAIETLSEQYMASGQFRMDLEGLWSGVSPWSGSSLEEISAPIGWHHSGEPVEVSFGDAPVHGMLGGATGSGKSNTLHVLIHSLCHKYSPQELQLYLLDYKEGMEFSAYAQPYLPHAKTVATESDASYGLMVLNHLCDEMSRRASLFKDCNVSCIADYRRETKKGMPRLLLIIDEFLNLLDPEALCVKEVGKRMEDLMRQGRAYGIHVLLCTQSLTGLKNMPNGVSGQVVGNIGCHVALHCETEEDSRSILGGQNNEAISLKPCCEGIVNMGGGIAGNVRFRIPKADNRIRQEHLDMFSKLAVEKHVAYTPCVFNGAELPVVPSEEEFSLVVKEQPKIYLGRSYDFEGSPFTVDVSKEGFMVAGADMGIRKGVAHSIMNSLKQFACKQDVLYYGACEDTLLSEDEIAQFATFRDYTWDCSDLADFTNTDQPRYLIVDSLDYAEDLLLVKKNADILGNLVDYKRKSLVKVILLVENYESMLLSAKTILNKFRTRVGFDMDEDEAGKFVTGGTVNKIKGLDGGKKAVFKKNHDRLFIKPFIFGE